MNRKAFCYSDTPPYPFQTVGTAAKVKMASALAYKQLRGCGLFIETFFLVLFLFFGGGERNLCNF